MKTKLYWGLSLLIVLFCITPHISLAQESNDEIVELAYRAAEADTSPLWYLGCLFPPTCMIVGAGIGFQIGLNNANSYAGLGISFGLGASVGFLTPITLVSISEEPYPSSTTFIGKSPEYVAIYTAAYQKRTKDLKRTPMKTGMVLTIGGTFLLGFLNRFRG